MDLEDLVEFLEKKGRRHVNEVGLSHLVHYMAELDKRGYAGSTRKRKTISIKSFFSFLYAEGYTATNVSKQLIPPYVENRKPRYLTADEYNRLLRCAKANRRDYAIIQILLHTGMKLSELVGLTLDDLQITDVTSEKGNMVEYIRVVGNQRNKDRMFPLNLKAGMAINSYLAIRKESLSDNLFLNRSGEKLGERGVEKIVGKYLIAAGIKNASVNSLRHTFGIRLVLKGINPKIIKRIMGYNDSRTASRYLSLSKELGIRELDNGSL